MSSPSSRGPNPSGLCMCGCGKKTRLATRNRHDLGHVKDRPLRFRTGHQARGDRNPFYRGGRCLISVGYWGVRKPDHPRAHVNGFVFEHILIAEQALGRPLPENAVVHHANGDRRDNRRSNLVICQDRAYHNLLHRRMRRRGVAPRRRSR